MHHQAWWSGPPETVARRRRGVLAVGVSVRVAFVASIEISTAGAGRLLQLAWFSLSSCLGMSICLLAICFRRASATNVGTALACSGTKVQVSDRHAFLVTCPWQVGSSIKSCVTAIFIHPPPLHVEYTHRPVRG
jgi:hypothetical protein